MFSINMENVSFKSRINFVNYSAYKRRVNGIYIDFEPIMDCFCKNGKFWTDNIRTCTAIGLINTDTKEALGVHYHDSEINYKMLEHFLERMFKWINNPNRCLIIGSKDLKSSEFSIPTFDKIYKILSERIENMTVFGKHKYSHGQSHIHYNIDNDAWDICTENGVFHEDVYDEKTLKNSFQTIRIADGDSLYINDKQIILPKENRFQILKPDK